MNDNKRFNIVKQNYGAFIFLLIMVIIVSILKVYQSQHPLVCSSTGKVKEILSINENYAEIKLQNEQIINYPISIKKEVTTPSIVADPAMSMLYSDNKTVTEFNAHIKLGDNLCLEYSRK